jgi:hypothetical protein
LHDDWLIRVLRPNSVSTGCTDRQFDLAPQSPQPSHTRSLIMTRCAGVGRVPRLRLRRFSAAHSWSWISTVVPLVRASSCCTSSRSSRCRTSTPGPAARRVTAGSSLVITTWATPSARSSATSRRSDSPPTMSWPPVIATAELYSSL